MMTVGATAMMTMMKWVQLAGKDVGNPAEVEAPAGGEAEAHVEDHPEAAAGGGAEAREDHLEAAAGGGAEVQGEVESAAGAEAREEVLRMALHTIGRKLWKV